MDAFARVHTEVAYASEFCYCDVRLLALALCEVRDTVDKGKYHEVVYRKG
jgi:hypothetical protein